MLSEISQIFLNFRNTVGKDAEGTIPLINNVLFFVTYTLSRIAFFPFCFIGHIRASYDYDYANSALYNKLIFWEIIVTFGVIWLLNIFWYTFIVKGIIKILKGDSSVA